MVDIIPPGSWYAAVNPAEVFGIPMLTSVHYQPNDPGTDWVKDPEIAVDVREASGMWRIITPNVVELERGYRMYYTESGPGMDYRTSPASILSAFSLDGDTWEPEPGVRLAPHESGASLRVVCPDVIPLPDGGWRMYFEGQPHVGPSSIMSAYSGDGLEWEHEPGIRFGDWDVHYGSPRCLYFEADGRMQYRLYFHSAIALPHAGVQSDKTIISAISDDGVHFKRELGARISQTTEFETATVYAPEVLRLGDGTYRMYYAGWSADPMHGRILSATSPDGLTWTKDLEPSVVFGGLWDTLKCSEPCIMRLPDGRYRMYYEANDAHGIWRILSASTR
jgi:predicted GH43/DUF377 family glycosyl hydrolase